MTPEEIAQIDEFVVGLSELQVRNMLAYFHKWQEAEAKLRAAEGATEARKAAHVPPRERMPCAQPNNGWDA